MTDETGTAPTTKRRGGWTKGKPRKTIPQPREKMTAETLKASVAKAQMASMKARMKARPNWETEEFGVDFGEDRLGISREKIEALAKDGVALQWATKSVRGAEMRGEMSKMAQGGWTPVHASDFEGILDTGQFVPRGADEMICVDDCQLVARPMALHEKAKLGEQMLANERLDGPRQVLREGIPVKGGNHPTVRNQINVGMDRVDIPD